MTRRLENLLGDAHQLYPDRVAIEGPDEQSVSYGKFAGAVAKIAALLQAQGIGNGDRVGIYAHKSINTVAAMFGIMTAGAAYVPVDPDAPIRRNAYIFSDCQVKAVWAEDRLLSRLQGAFPAEQVGRVLRIDDVSGICLQEIQFPDTVRSDDHLAYILYTSGSTGQPKGVMISHENALSFVDWCSDTFQPMPEDRFSSHAPFHFDLSILDLYVSFKHGATLVLIDEVTAKQPAPLAAFIADRRITVWYSAPSILSMMTQFGCMETHNYDALRLVLFAGEVFPVKYLRSLKQIWQQARYFNLYGPTETNVCTYHEIPADIPFERNEPYPIGKSCSHVDCQMLTGEDGSGELVVRGASVMNGYWRLPERSAKSYHIDDKGAAWYKTGDLVQIDTAGDFIFLGRLDRMVKRRGYRIELGEIEAALYRHPAILEVAVVAESVDEELTITAFISTAAEEKLSLIKLKQFCADHLPLYMMPDRFNYLDGLPKTSTGKVDYQQLSLQEA